MTDEQIVYILNHPRDDKGRLDLDAYYLDNEESPKAPDGPVMPVSFRKLCVDKWRKQDPSVSEEQLSKRFKEKYPKYRG